VVNLGVLPWPPAGFDVEADNVLEFLRELRVVLPAIRLLVAPAHGSVTVKRGTLKAPPISRSASPTEVPALLAFYRSAANFNGSDEFELEIAVQGGRKQLQHFRVDVSAGPGGGGQGI